MKKITLFSFLVCASFGLFAQGDGLGNQHQISINASTFVKNFFSFNSNAMPTSPYQFMYRNINSNGGAWRVQVGFQYLNLASEDEDGDDKSNFTSSSIQSGLGYEKRTKLNDRWMYYFGVQVLFNHRSDVSTNTSGDFSSSDKTIAISGGIGGIVGIQFNINDRISLGTEGTLPILYTMSKNTSEFDSNVSIDKSEVLTLQPTLPTFLYFNINL